MQRLFHSVLAAILLAAGLVLISQSVPAQTNGSGLPLPRFVSLRAGEVNMRTGPGVQYPVEWVYRRQALPVEVVAEYGTWRKVRDWQGTQGWVHQSMLSGRRAMIVTGKVRTLRSRQSVKSPPVAKLEPGVIGRLVECPEGGAWCRIEISGREGWLRRVEFWGTYRSEALE